MPEEKESILRKIRAEIRKIWIEFILGLVVAVVTEPTIKALNLDRLIPWVPYIWLVIFVSLTLDALWRWKRLRSWLLRFYASLPRRKKIAFCAALGIFGLTVFIGYWCVITVIFSMQEHTSKGVNTDSLKEKYPLGYCLFTGDTQTNFIRKNSESLKQISLLTGRIAGSHSPMLRLLT
jgi:hypothetical protein